MSSVSTFYFSLILGYNWLEIPVGEVAGIAFRFGNLSIHGSVLLMGCTGLKSQEEK